MKPHKIIKVRNQFGRITFIALVRYRLLWIIPIWISVRYEHASQTMTTAFFLFHFHHFTFQEAEESVRRYKQYKSAKIVKREVQRKTEIKK